MPPTTSASSAQTLRRWDPEGQLPAVRRPGNSHRYYRRADLEQFRLSTAAPRTRPRVSSSCGERRHRSQRAAARAAARGAPGGAGALRQSRTSRGSCRSRSGAARPGSCPPAVRNRRRPGAGDHAQPDDPQGCPRALDITSRECFWTKTRVLSTSRRALDRGAGRARRQHARRHRERLRRHQRPAAREPADRWLPQFPPDFFDLILVDEGHHAAAESWQKVFRRFPDAKVVSLTATPFRADEQQLHGEVLYRFRSPGRW